MDDNEIAEMEEMDKDEVAGLGSIPDLGLDPGELDVEDMFLNDLERDLVAQGECSRSVDRSLGHQRGNYRPVFAHESDPFKPTIITIGPIHRKMRGLLAMKDHKNRFLVSILRSAELMPGDLTKAMKELEEETRNFYPEKFPNISSDGFVEMLVDDGCFIVNLMRLNYKRSQGEHIDDPIFTTRRILPILRRDLLLVENQLPLSVLTKLFSLTSTATDEPPLKKLALNFFEPLRPDKAAVPPPSDIPSDGKHLLALLQRSCLRSFNPPNDLSPEQSADTDTEIRIPDIQQLRYSGVRIRENSESAHLLDIKFKGIKLKIPPLLIDNDSNVVLRNLLAYELSSLEAPTYIASLALFYGRMVTNLQDLKVLQKANVIRAHLVADQQVLNLIKALSEDLSILQVDDFYLEQQIKKINDYFESIFGKLVRFKRRLPLIRCLKSLLRRSCRCLCMCM